MYSKIIEEKRIPFHDDLVRNDTYFLGKEINLVTNEFFVMNEIKNFTYEINFVTYEINIFTSENILSRVNFIGQF